MMKGKNKNYLIHMYCDTNFMEMAPTEKVTH